jgi:hypothetical protein
MVPTKYRNNQRNKPMHLISVYMTAYSVFSQTENGNCRLDEAFDGRPDWEATQPAVWATAGGYIISTFSAFLLAGLAYLAR